MFAVLIAKPRCSPARFSDFPIGRPTFNPRATRWDDAGYRERTPAVYWSSHCTSSVSSRCVIGSFATWTSPGCGCLAVRLSDRAAQRDYGNLRGRQSHCQSVPSRGVTVRRAVNEPHGRWRRAHDGPLNVPGPFRSPERDIGIRSNADSTRSSSFSPRPMRCITRTTRRAEASCSVSCAQE